MNAQTHSPDLDAQDAVRSSTECPNNLQCASIKKGLVWTRTIQFLSLTLLFINVVALPLFYYRSYHPDFHTVHNFGRAFLEGKDVYSGGNPYLPSSMLLWAAFALFEKPTGWVLFKIVTIGVACGTLVLVYRLCYEKLSLPAAVTWLCLLHIGLLAGFTAKSGNPGNIAAPLAVMGALFVILQKPHSAGIAIGLSLALKYPLALPIILVLAFGRHTRPTILAIAIFATFNILATAWLMLTGHDVSKVPHSVLAGVSHVGGYDESGFHSWFSANTRGKYSTLAAIAFFNTLGIDRTTAHTLSLGLLFSVTILACYVAAVRKDGVLISLAILAPAFLTFTYHRYYDSALLAFPILLAWTVAVRGIGLTWIGSVLTLFMSLFLLRSLSYNLVYRFGASSAFLQGALYNFVLGPLHIYALFMAIAFGLYCAVCVRTRAVYEIP